MESFTLEQASYLAEIIGVIAVVISLFYVGLQIRQNANAIRLNAAHNITEELRDIYSFFTRDIKIAEIVLKGMKDPESIEGPEHLLFYGIMHNMIKGYENAYYQWVDGALDTKLWTSNIRSLFDMSDLPGMQTYWNKRKHWYTEDFQCYMDEDVFPVGATTGYKLAGT